MTIHPKKRTVYSYSILSYRWPSLDIEITVSSGTYIRSIARDLGIFLETGGYLEKLERLSIGHMTMDTHLWMQHNDIRYAPISHEVLFPNIQVLELSPEEKMHLRLGSTPLSTPQENGKYFIIYDDNTYGLLEARD